ncbi:unnamed protein product, partial [Polarella glacialis]
MALDADGAFGAIVGQTEGYWLSQADFLQSGEEESILDEPGLKALGFPRDWPAVYSQSAALKSLIGKRGRIPARKVAVAGSPTPEELGKLPRGLCFSPLHSFANSERAAQAAPGLAVVRGWALYERLDRPSGSSFVAERYWWNALPDSGGWVDLTPRPAGWQRLLLAEAADDEVKRKSTLSTADARLQALLLAQRFPEFQLPAPGPPGAEAVPECVFQTFLGGRKLLEQKPGGRSSKTCIDRVTVHKSGGVDYSKFSNIEDSDDEKLVPKQEESFLVKKRLPRLHPDLVLDRLLPFLALPELQPRCLVASLAQGTWESKPCLRVSGQVPLQARMWSIICICRYPKDPDAYYNQGAGKDLHIIFRWPDEPSMVHEEMVDSIHAANANCAAMQADIAAKHAASLAQWVQYLWTQIASLQGKVVELEDWKKKTLDDMTRLRFEHKLLRRRVCPAEEVDDEPKLPAKAKSMPLVLADHVDDGFKVKGLQTSMTAPASSMRPPPGLEVAQAATEAANAKQVRFSAPSEKPQGLSCSGSASPQTPSGGVPRSVSSFSDFGGSLAGEPLDEGPLEGINVVMSTTADGEVCQLAEWRIGHLSTKLKGCMGRALVSSPFSAWGLEDIRLMVFPDGKEPVKGPRSRRQKELYLKKVSEGPLDGCLKLKVPDCPAPHVIEYFLSIGSVRCGPFKHNFGESTVNGCLDFAIDWLGQ